MATYDFLPGQAPATVTLGDPSAPDRDPSLELRAFGMAASAFTFELMLALPANPGGSGVTIAQYGLGAHADAEFAISTWSDYLDVYIAGVRFDTTISTNALVGATAHRISITWDSATGQAYAYLDGALRGSAIVAQGVTIDSGQPLVLGSGSGNDLTPAYTYGDVRVFDHVRTAQQIADFDQVTLDPAAETGLAGYWAASSATTLASQVAGIADIVLDEDIVNYARDTRPVTIDTGDAEVNVMVDGLLMDSAYTAGTVITYTFALSSTLDNTWSEMDPEMVARAREHLAHFTELTGIQTVEITDEADQDVNLYFGANASVSTAYVINHRGGILFAAKPTQTDPTPGTYSDHILLHELGHALGLAHGHVADALPPEYQGYDWTVMSYRAHPDSTSLVFAGRGPETWMLADIATLQYQFGANFAFNAGDTVYTWSPTTGETFIDGVSQGRGSSNDIYRTVWDGNGTDTYDLSSYHGGVVVDLAPGRFSTLSTVQLARLGKDPAGKALYASGNVANAYLFESDTRSLIENAIGGRGNDHLTGNQSGNVLIGGGGADRLDGGQGDDRLIGDGGTAHGLSAAMYGLALNTGSTTGQSLKLTGATGLPRTALTFELVIKLDTASATQWFLAAPGFQLMFDPSNAGAPGLWVFVDGSSTYSSIAMSELADGAAHRVSFTWDGTTGEFAHYLDGVSVKTGTAFKTGAVLSATGTGNISFDPEGGTFGDLRLYDRALSAQEVYDGAGLTIADGATSDGLVLNWQVAADGTIVDAAGGTAPTITGAPQASALLSATEAGDVLLGGDGDDSLTGGAGDDIVTGDLGDDTFYTSAGDGNDSYDGGDGRDQILFDSLQTAVIADLSAGNASGADIGSDTLTGIEDLTGGAAADILTGSASDNRLSGLAGADVISGGDGSDTLLGGDAADRLHGNGGNDELSGDAGRDVLYGDAGNDRLSGGAQGDRISGGTGNDRILGGAGRDVIFGGKGRDVFDYDGIKESRGSVHDSLRDFQHKLDDIDLATIDANVKKAGNQVFKYLGFQDFTHHAGELRIVQSGRVQQVEGDVNGDGRADFRIDVTGVGSLTKIDFIL